MCCYAEIKKIFTRFQDKHGFITREQLPRVIEAQKVVKMEHTRLVYWAHEVARRSESHLHANPSRVVIVMHYTTLPLELEKLTERMFLNLITAKPDFTNMTPNDYLIANWFSEIDLDNNGWITLEDHNAALERDKSREKADRKAPKWLEEQELEVEFEGEIHYLREYARLVSG